MSDTPLPSPRRRRADAVRNRAALLDAARGVLSAESTADLRTIAQRAGVGVATVFRHFENREALLDAVLTDDLDRWEAETAAAVAPETDPGAALERFLDLTLERQLARPGLSRLYLDHWGQDTMSRVGAWYSELLDDLAARCRGAGALRPDVTGTDLDLVLVGAGHLAVTRPDSARRFVELLLTGLRPTQPPSP